MYGLLTYEDYHLSTLCSCMINLSSKQQNTTTLQFARQDTKNCKLFSSSKRDKSGRPTLVQKGELLTLKEKY